MEICAITERDRQDYLAMAGEFYSSSAVIKSVPQGNLIATFNECLSSKVYAECFIFRRGGKVAGYGLIAKTFSQEAGGLVIWFEEVYVKEEYRGRGFGGKFFEYVFKLYPAARYRLEVERQNERAVKLYEKLGFEFFEYDQMIKEKI